MAGAFHCGEAICKKVVSDELAGDTKWPIRCAACRVSLYPRDVLDALPINELAPNRAVLKRNAGGKLVDATTRDLGLKGALGLCDLPEGAAGPGRRALFGVVGGLLALLALAALAWFFLAG